MGRALPPVAASSAIAVLGGGLTGCCVAIALAEAGRAVTLFERDDDLMRGASFANEGKIHLGYVYAGDRSLATARRMITGALAFEPLLRRYLGIRPDLAVSAPFLYAVSRQSQIDTDGFAAHLAAVDTCIAEAVSAGGGSYFGRDKTVAPRRLAPDEVAAHFDPREIVAAFETGEVAIEPETLAHQVRARIAQDPRIRVATTHTVTAVVDDGPDRIVVVTRAGEQTARETFSGVVNALWDGRLAIDAARGLRPARQWFHRLKYGVRFDAPEHASIPSATVVLGPFGDTVRYGDGTIYLSWYPAGMRAHSLALAPDWEAPTDAAATLRIVEDSVAGMGRIVPALRSLELSALGRLRLKGGTITAWGETDIDDRQSGLHRRHEIGVHSDGRYHSIDTGKLTMAPYFASVCAERILSV